MHPVAEAHRPRRTKRGRDQRGSALAEFVVIVGVLLLTALAVFEFGRGLHTYVSVIQSAREGARAAMDSTKSDSAIQQIVVNAAAPISVSATVTRTSGKTTVTATTNFTASLPMISQIWGGGPLVISRTFTSQ